jgi:hypothetical protein
MSLIKKTLTAVAVAGGVTAAVLGVGASVAVAQPPAPPDVGEPVPAWAPQKPAEVWDGRPVVWTSAWGGRWGVWINGAFITLSSNPVTNGG